MYYLHTSEGVSRVVHRIIDYLFELLIRFMGQKIGQTSKVCLLAYKFWANPSVEWMMKHLLLDGGQPPHENRVLKNFRLLLTSTQFVVRILGVCGCCYGPILKTIDFNRHALEYYWHLDYLSKFLVRVAYMYWWILVHSLRYPWSELVIIILSFWS